MSLNNISLSPQLITDLYHLALVGNTATAELPKAAVPVLGKNAKHILLVVNKPNLPFLPDSELDFLTKVLTACQLGLGDVAIVNWSKMPQQDAEDLLEQVPAKQVILFDVEPSLFGLPEALAPYTISALQNREFVAAPALKEIEKTREAKQQLWMALKQLFAV